MSSHTTCTWCGKTLVPIGTARNGYTGDQTDWCGRTLHKKCWKERQEVIEITGMYPMDSAAANFILTGKTY